METAGGRQAAGLDVAAGVHARPHRYELFQAARLLELEALHARDGRKPLGFDHAPGSEAVRFRAAPTLGFPAAPLRDERTRSEAREQPELHETALGLVGALGVLPQHYTELVLRRVQQKDTALRDFLDLFHHRATALYYRAWRKQRFAFDFEHARLAAGEDDDFTRALRALVGLGTAGLHDADEPLRRAWIHYAGYFASPRRTQAGLESLLGDALGAPVRVEQLVGRWIELEEDQYSRLSSAPGDGPERRLGLGFVLGTRVWDVQTRIVARAGPLTHAQFSSLLPGSPRLRALERLVRDYLDAGIACDLDLVLAVGEATPAALGGGARLGRDMFAQAAPRSSAPKCVRIALDTDRARSAASPIAH